MKRAIVIISVLNMVLTVSSYAAEDENFTASAVKSSRSRNSSEILSTPLKGIPLSTILKAATHNPDFPFKGRQEQNIKDAYSKICTTSNRNTVESFLLELNSLTDKAWIHGQQYKGVKKYFKGLGQERRAVAVLLPSAEEAIKYCTQRSYQKLAPWLEKVITGFFEDYLRHRSLSTLKQNVNDYRNGFGAQIPPQITQALISYVDKIHQSHPTTQAAPSSSESQQSMPAKLAPWAPKRTVERKSEAKFSSPPPVEFLKETLDLPVSHPQLMAPDSPRLTSPPTSPEQGLSNFELEDSSRSNSSHPSLNLETAISIASNTGGTNSDSHSDIEDDDPDQTILDALIPADLFEDEPSTYVFPGNLFSDDE